MALRRRGARPVFSRAGHQPRHQRHVRRPSRRVPRLRAVIVKIRPRGNEGIGDTATGQPVKTARHIAVKGAGYYSRATTKKLSGRVVHFAMTGGLCAYEFEFRPLQHARPDHSAPALATLRADAATRTHPGPVLAQKQLPLY